MTEKELNALGRRIDRLRLLRDEMGWPEPRTIDDLRRDHRVRLRNQLRPGRDEDLELAAALILLVADDLRAGAVR